MPESLQFKLQYPTQGRGLYEITAPINEQIAQADFKDGLCHLFIPHTSASLVITENADPQVLRDLDAFFNRLVPDGDRLFKHTAEGPDDMPAHVRSTLTQTALTLPVHQGQLALGTWQGVFLWEHRHQKHIRKLTGRLF